MTWFASAVSSLVRLMVLAAISILLTLILTLLVPLGEYSLYAWGIIFVFAWWYVTATRRLKKTRLVPPDDWRWDVIPEKSPISGRAFDRLRYILADPSYGQGNREDAVRRVSRKHWLALVGWEAIPVLLLAGSLYLQFFVPQASNQATVQPSVATTTSTPPTTLLPEVIGSLDLPTTYDLQWWQFLLLDLGLLVLIGLCSIPWLYSFRILTNRRLILATVPPAWLPWFPAPDRYLPLSKVTVAHKEDNVLQNMFGCGRVKVDSAAGLDKEFNTITLVPDHENFASDLNASLPT